MLNIHLNLYRQIVHNNFLPEGIKSEEENSTEAEDNGLTELNDELEINQKELTWYNKIIQNPKKVIVSNKSKELNRKINVYEKGLKKMEEDNKNYPLAKKVLKVLRKQLDDLPINIPDTIINPDWEKRNDRIIVLTNKIKEIEKQTQRKEEEERKIKADAKRKQEEAQNDTKKKQEEAQKIAQEKAEADRVQKIAQEKAEADRIEKKTDAQIMEKKADAIIETMREMGMEIKLSKKTKEEATESEGDTATKKQTSKKEIPKEVSKKVTKVKKYKKRRKSVAESAKKLGIDKQTYEKMLGNEDLINAAKLLGIK